MKTITIPQAILETNTLDAIEKILYMYLLSLDEHQTPDYQQLMAVTGVRSRTTLSKKLKILQAKGLLQVKATYTANGFQGRNHYCVVLPQTPTQTPLEQLLFATLPNVSLQDQATFSRLCDKYSQPLMQFVLESVKGKAKKANWGYITAMLKRLAPTCQTYDDCVQQAQAFFAQKAAATKQRQKELKQKYALIMQLIHLDVFGEISNPPAYAKRILADANHKNCDVYELFELFTGWHHLNAYSYDIQVFDILYS